MLGSGAYLGEVPIRAANEWPFPLGLAVGGLDIEIYHHLVPGVVGDRVGPALGKTWTTVSYLDTAYPPSEKQLAFDDSHAIDLLPC